MCFVNVSTAKKNLVFFLKKKTGALLRGQSNSYVYGSTRMPTYIEGSNKRGDGSACEPRFSLPNDILLRLCYPIESKR